MTTLPKQEIGSPGFSDALDKRLKRIASLLAVQRTQARSKRLLLSLFQNFSRVFEERAVYLSQVPSATKTRTISWSDGYLEATADAINFYLERRFSVPPITFQECELIIGDPALTELFEQHGTRTAGSNATPEADAGGGADLSIAETREGAPTD
jgi:hypothetical protein